MALPLWPQSAQLCPREAHTLSVCLSSVAALGWLGMSCVQHFTWSNTMPHGTDETECAPPPPELVPPAAWSALGGQPLGKGAPCARAWRRPFSVWPFLSLCASCLKAPGGLSVAVASSLPSRLCLDRGPGRSS